MTKALLLDLDERRCPKQTEITQQQRRRLQWLELIE
jgi:hypothetical protein